MCFGRPLIGECGDFFIECLRIVATIGALLLKGKGEEIVGTGIGGFTEDECSLVGIFSCDGVCVCEVQWR